MNRRTHFDYILDKLNTLASLIERRGRLNLLDLHQHSEDFYAHLCNAVFDWKLQNLNAINPNFKAIDLIDDANKIIAQVSATATKNKSNYLAGWQVLSSDQVEMNPI
jgi:hypothetical protein